jgi:hypothetical protein
VKRRTPACFCLTFVLTAACNRPPPDATPDGAVRAFLEELEASADDPDAMREAYTFLGNRARANLKERADRASKGQGRRYQPHEMLAEGRFGLTFRPKLMTAKVDGNEAFVEVQGDTADEHATVHCRHEPAGWRVDLELPDVIAPQRRADAGAP